jgi:hypothetical protein
MYPFGGIIVAGLVAGYLAAVLCRLRCRRGKAPSWFAALGPSLVGLLAALAATFQGDLFRPSHWSSKTDGLTMFLIAAVPSSFVALALASSVVAYYREKFALSKSMP